MFIVHISDTICCSLYMDVLIWTSTLTTANGIERLETFRDDKGMVVLQSLRVSQLSAFKFLVDFKSC